jgi:hypothetical protein
LFCTLNLTFSTSLKGLLPPMMQLSPVSARFAPVSVSAVVQPTAEKAQQRSGTLVNEQSVAPVIKKSFLDILLNKCIYPTIFWCLLRLKPVKREIGGEFSRRL